MDPSNLKRQPRLQANAPGQLQMDFPLEQQSRHGLESLDSVEPSLQKQSI